MIKIITCTWDCKDELEKTLRSIRMQQGQNENYQVHVVDDGSDAEQQEFVRNWCASHFYFGCTLNIEKRYGPYNQYWGVRYMNPQDGDIIVFLDGDGDELATPDTLSVIQQAYDEGALVTYGSLQTKSGAVITGSTDYPQEVIDTNSYRQHTREFGTRFNHLRTVSWKVLSQIPEWNFKWNDGTWFEAGTDYAVMIPALEIANGRFKHIKETTLLYNDQQPHPDYLHHGAMTRACTDKILSRPNILEVIDGNV